MTAINPNELHNFLDQSNSGEEAKELLAQKEQAAQKKGSHKTEIKASMTNQGAGVDFSKYSTLLEF